MQSPRPADLETPSMTQESQSLTSTPSLSGESEKHQSVRTVDPMVSPETYSLIRLLYSSARTPISCQGLCVGTVFGSRGDAQMNISL